MTDSSNRYTLDRISPTSLSDAKAAWLSLEDGPDMTSYQRFDWAVIANERVLHERASRLTVRTRYYVVSRNGTPVLIAPIRVHLTPLSPGHSRGIHLAGRNGPADYLNFVYQDFDPLAARVALDSATEDFGVTQVCLERLLADTSAFRWFQELKYSTLRLHEAMILRLPESPEGYAKSLSKSTRQNIRTGWNRAEKDGVDIRVETLQQVTPVEANQLSALKRRREITRSARSITRRGQIQSAVRKAYFATLFLNYDEPRHAMTRANDPVVIRISANGQLAAFAFGLTDQKGGVSTLRLIQVAIDEEFARYSPGFIGLHKFISDEISSGKPRWDAIDFTRGNERYKTQLGAEPHHYGDLSFQWPA